MDMWYVGEHPSQLHACIVVFISHPLMPIANKQKMNVPVTCPIGVLCNQFELKVY